MATAQTRKAKTKPVFAFTAVPEDEAVKLLAISRAKKSAWLDVVKQFVEYHDANPSVEMVELDIESHDPKSASGGLYNALRSARKRHEFYPVDVRTREIEGKDRVFVIYNENSVNMTPPPVEDNADDNGSVPDEETE